MLLAEEILERFSDDVDVLLKDLLEGFAPLIANIAGYYFGWVDENFHPIKARKGKKLRPTLNLLVCEAISGSCISALPIAAALELIHNYSLIHDDIMDRDMERRGRPTLWRICGDNIAINVGDALHALAFRSLHNITSVPAEKVLELHTILATTSLRLCEGQHMDVIFETTVDVSHDMYLEMIERKTAALIECATHTAAILASEDRELITAYKNFGRNLGLAFQIRDDYLNIWGDTTSFGKDICSDLRKKKKTFPVIYTMGMLNDEERTNMIDIYKSNREEMSESEIATILAYFEQVHARDYTAEMVQHYVGEALTWLGKSDGDQQAHTQLRILSSFLTGRNV